MRRAVVPLVVLVLATLACGSFASRPTPTPLPATPTALIEVDVATVTPTPTPELPTSVPTRNVPTPTFTPTPIPGTVIIVGQPARVVAVQGLNVRKDASVTGDRLGRFGPGTIVSVLEGPVDVDGYRWWRVGTNELSGWVADGDDSAEWLSPDVGGTQPVDRPVRLGDDVIVTVGSGGSLTIRTKPGLDALVEHRLSEGTELSVLEGPVDVDGYRWWRISDNSSITGWAAEGTSGERWMTPLE